MVQTFTVLVFILLYLCPPEEIYAHLTIIIVFCDRVGSFRPIRLPKSVQVCQDALGIAWFLLGGVHFYNKDVLQI